MAERYDLVRAVVDPVRAEQLRGTLRQELRDVSPFERPQQHVAPGKEIDVLLKDDTKRMRGGRVLALAAAVAAVGLIGTVIAISVRDSDGSSPGNEPPVPTTAATLPSSVPTTAATVPPSTAPATVPPTTVATSSDAEIAAATLLVDGEYGPGFVPLTLNGTAPWGAGLKMDSAIAERVPACAPYIEAAFESPGREAAVAYTFFNTTPPAPPSPEPQYVVVFPDEDAAQAMFDAVTDPGFIDGCVPGYLAQMTDPAFGDPDFVWFPFWPETTTLDPPQLDLSADQVLLRAYTDQPDAQGNHFVASTVRVGRVVAQVDAITQHANGDPAVVTTEQIQHLLSRIVDRARAGLDGQPPPATAPPPSTIPALTDAEIAAATLLADGEYASGFVPLTLDGTAPWGAGMKMDSAIAEQVPACAPYIDAAFESPGREAAVAYTFFNRTAPAPPSPEPQYVVVFPEEDAARAMFDAITDPGFLDGCVSGYHAQMTDPAFGDPDFVWFPFFNSTTDFDPPTLNLSADQVLVRAYEDQSGGPNQNHFVTATLRVGRVVAHVDGITMDVNGEPVLAPEQFEQLASTIIDRANAALDGQPLPN